MDNNISTEFRVQCLALCRQGKHRTAHRMYMGETGASSLEAKEYIDKLCRENGAPIHLEPSDARRLASSTNKQGLSKKTLLIATLTTIIIILVALFIAGE